MNKIILALLSCGLLLSACTGSPAERSGDELPVEELPIAVRGAIEDLTSRMPVEMTDIMSLEYETAQWPDACLGLADEDEMCAQVIVPGYKVTITVAASQYVYRTDEAGEIVRLVPENDE